MSDPSARQSRPPPPRLEAFPHRLADVIRYGDLDAQGHVNNAVFFTHFESGRVAMFRSPDMGVGFTEVTVALAHIEATFLRELRWPGTVEIGTAVEAVGRTSFTVRQAIFHGGHCVATARAVMVLVDAAAGKPRPLGEEMIRQLQRFRSRNDGDRT